MMTKEKKAPLIGTAGGAVAGFFLGGPIGAAIGAGIGYLGGKRYGKTHGMTPERKKIFEAALKSMQDPVKLRKLADVYEAEGLKDEAELLRKRALLRELPPEKKAERKEIFRKALASTNPAAVDKVAAAFHAQGYTGNAAQLRQHAAGLKRAGST